VIGHCEAPTPTQPLSNFVLGDVAITFLAVALARQSGFDSLLLTQLQIESVSLHFPNDVLLDNFALEAPERVFKGFTVVKCGPRPTITSFFPWRKVHFMLTVSQQGRAIYLRGAVVAEERTACSRQAFFGHEDIGGVDIAISSAAKMTRQVIKRVH
jgi:hypothetical protein